MLGGMFSGHTECAGEVIERNGQKLKLFYGMSSDTAMKKHAGGVAEYRYGWAVPTGPARVSLYYCPLWEGLENRLSVFVQSTNFHSASI